MTLFELRKRLTDVFRESGKTGSDVRGIKGDTDCIIMSHFGLTFTGLTLNLDRTVTEEDGRACSAMAMRVLDGEPVQYVTGRAPFLGRYFKVTKDVLIPRLDTETLYGEAEKRLIASPEGRKVSVLDLCTGSGILAISLKLAFPEASVTASDISEKALEVARVNAGTYGADISFVCSDLFDAFDTNDRFGMIVCNPPYVADTEFDTLPGAVREYEPAIALSGGTDGLDFYRVISKNAPRFMKNGGWLCYEIGDTQGENVSSILAENGFEDVSVVRDIAGMERVVSGRFCEKK